MHSILQVQTESKNWLKSTQFQQISSKLVARPSVDCVTHEDDTSAPLLHIRYQVLLLNNFMIKELIKLWHCPVS